MASGAPGCDRGSGRLGAMLNETPAMSDEPAAHARALNLKTAKALGLTIPPSLLLRADQVIE